MWEDYSDAVRYAIAIAYLESELLVYKSFVKAIVDFGIHSEIMLLWGEDVNIELDQAYRIARKYYKKKWMGIAQNACYQM